MACGGAYADNEFRNSPDFVAAHRVRCWPFPTFSAMQRYLWFWEQTGSAWRTIEMT